MRIEETAPRKCVVTTLKAWKCDECGKEDAHGWDVFKLHEPWPFPPHGWVTLSEGGDPTYSPKDRHLCDECRKVYGV